MNPEPSPRPTERPRPRRPRHLDHRTPWPHTVHCPPNPATRDLNRPAHHPDQRSRLNWNAEREPERGSEPHGDRPNGQPRTRPDQPRPPSTETYRARPTNNPSPEPAQPARPPSGRPPEPIDRRPPPAGPDGNRRIRTGINRHPPLPVRPPKSTPSQHHQHRGREADRNSPHKPASHGHEAPDSNLPRMYAHPHTYPHIGVGGCPHGSRSRHGGHSV